MSSFKYLLPIYITLIAELASASSPRSSLNLLEHENILNVDTIESEYISFPIGHNRRRSSSFFVPERDFLPFILPSNINLSNVNSADISFDVMPVPQLGIIREVTDHLNFSNIINNIADNNSFRRSYLHPSSPINRSSFYVVRTIVPANAIENEQEIYQLLEVDDNMHLKEIKDITTDEINNIEHIEEEVAYNAILYELPTINLTTLAIINCNANQLEIRLSDLFLDTGVAAGNDNINKHGLWVKGSSSFMKQKKYQDIDAFKSRSQGINIGIDTLLNENNTIGIAYGINKIITRFDSSISKEKTDLHSFTFYLMNDKQPINLYYSLSLGQLHVKNSRDLIYNNKLVRSKHKGDIALLRISASKNYLLNTVFITPKISLNSNYLKTDPFQENGVFLSKSLDQKTSIEPGISFSKVISLRYVSFIPFIYYNGEINLLYKQKKPRVLIVDTFDTLIANKSKRNKLSHRVGGKVELMSETTRVSLGYDFLMQKKNVLHSITTSLKYQF